MMKHRELIVPGLILLTSAALSIASFTHGQIWGDDFAAYLMQARSLLDGTPGEFIERNAFTQKRPSRFLPTTVRAFNNGRCAKLGLVHADFI